MQFLILICLVFIFKLSTVGADACDENTPEWAGLDMFEGVFADLWAGLWEDGRLGTKL
jgi:hypothetical protein